MTPVPQQVGPKLTPVQQQVNDPSSSDDDSDQDMDTLEGENDNEEMMVESVSEEELLKLELAVKEQPFNYEAHVRLLGKLRQAGELPRLRDARERMSTQFPLSPRFWLEWINDEMGIAHDEASPKIRELFERAVADYTSLEVWLEFCQWAIGAMQPEETREVFERALIAVGLHVSRGILLWDAYREFELALLTVFKSNESSENEQQIDVQKQRILKIFKRELAQPLQGIDDTYTEFQEFLTNYFHATPNASGDHLLKDSFKFAKSRLEELTPFEDALENSATPNIDAYKAYLDHERKYNIPPRMICLYERAITDNCLNADLWLQYADYINRDLKQGEQALSIYKRAVRNCVWSTQLWIHYLLALERYEGYSKKLWIDGEQNNSVTSSSGTALASIVRTPNTETWQKIDELFNESLKGVFTTSAEAVELWLTYVCMLRRKAECVLQTPPTSKEAASSKDAVLHQNGMRNGQLEEPDYSLVAQTLEKGAAFLRELYGTEWDVSCVYRKTWALMAAKHCRNPAKMRELWTEILKEGNGRYTSVWLDYYAMERAYGMTDGTDLLSARENCRKLLQKSISTVSDYPDVMFEVWLQFEREEGTLESLDLAIAKVQTQRQRTEERAAAAAAKQQSKHKQQKEQQQKGPRKRGLPEDSKPEAADRPKPQQTKSSPKNTEKVSKPPHRGAEARPPGEPPSTTTPKNGDIQQTQDSEGFAVPMGAPPPKKPKVVPATGNNQFGPVKTSEQQPTKAGTSTAIDVSKYDRQIFVSNLDFKFKEDELRAIFDDIGQILEVRMVKHPSGRFKGFAYIEFANVDMAKAALARDRLPVNGRPIYVSECQEKGRAKDKGGHLPTKYGGGLEKNKLFVRNIPVDVTEKELEPIFAPLGELKSIRIATFRSGKSKGFAYIEYADEATAAKALLRTDGTVIEGQTISVAISNPPPRGERAPQGAQIPPPPSYSYTPALGGQGSASGNFSAPIPGQQQSSADISTARKVHLDVFAPRATVVSRKPASEVAKQEKPVSKQQETAGNLNWNSSPTKTVEEKAVDVEQSAAKAKKSNEEFRKMFLKN